MSLGLLDLLYTLLFKRKSAPGEPAVLDVCLGDPQAAALRDLLQKADFDAAQSVLKQAPDWETLDLWVRAGSEWPGRPEWLDAWVRQRPDSAHAWLLRGAHGIQWAWEARGSGMGSSVKQDAARLYYQRLDEAQEDLESAVHLDPGSPLPSARSIPALMGMQCEPEQVEATFDYAIERAPTLLSAHLAMQTALTAKWGGSAQEMFAFARAHAGKSSALQMLIPAAHIEAFIAIENTEERKRYGKLREFRQDINQAFDQFCRKPERPAAIVAANYFAFAFCLAEDAERAKRAFALAGRYATKLPWAYLGEPLPAFERYRKRMLSLA